MALKKNALVPSERLKICTHELGGMYTGEMPGTGSYKCYMCSTRLIPFTRIEDENKA